MIRILLIISLFSFVSFFQINSCDKNGSATNSNNNQVSDEREKVEIIENEIKKMSDADVEDTVEAEFLKISELNRKNPKKGIFATKGFVAKIYTCPPCPPDAVCKPCMGDNIVISDENKNLESYDLTEKEMIIFTAKAKSFTKEKEYNFKVKILDSKTTSAGLNDAKLINAELIKD